MEMNKRYRGKDGVIGYLDIIMMAPIKKNKTNKGKKHNRDSFK